MRGTLLALIILHLFFDEADSVFLLINVQIFLQSMITVETYAIQFLPFSHNGPYHIRVSTGLVYRLDSG